MNRTAALLALLIFGAGDQATRPVLQSDEPAAVLTAEKAWAGPDVLLPLIDSSDPTVRRYALRAVGRLEDPSVVPRLLALAETDAVSGPAIAGAIAQSLQEFDPKQNPALVDRVAIWLQRLASAEDLARGSAYFVPLGRIVYANPDQVHAAEGILRNALERSANARTPPWPGIYASAARALEILGRRNARTARFEDESVIRLRRMVANTYANDESRTVRFKALGALVAAGVVDGDTIKTALDDEYDEVRRLAVNVLGGAGAGLEDEERASLIQARLGDRSAFVRYDALRAYVRRGAAHGCAPVFDRLADPDSHVAIAAIDALGDVCGEDANATARVLPLVRTPPAHGPWNRETHAFVALARRQPESAAISMEAFATHPRWWVRMYAVQAAVALKDVVRLERLAYDANDNVREAALGPIRRLKVAGADDAVVAALGRSDVQLLRTASLMLKDVPRNEKLIRPLLDALRRLTKEAKETSRDARVPLLEAIDAHGVRDSARELEPLLKDFDPVVAAKAAGVIAHLTGDSVVAEATRIQRGWPQAFDNLNVCVAVNLASGRSFTMQMDPRAAPITVDRFLKLALKDHYYDGLMIHRVVPNFVIQGGSPGANEYAGHKEYMRDEIAGSNVRGTVGLSTRGRNTADAQFFINLVDNARLDYQYTVFAHVADIGAVDAIEEGAEIRSMVYAGNFTAARPCR